MSSLVLLMQSIAVAKFGVDAIGQGHKKENLQRFCKLRGSQGLELESSLKKSIKQRCSIQNKNI